MYKPYYERLKDALKPDDQTERAFYVDQLERCYEALKDACTYANRDKDGKPIIYCRYVGKGGTPNIALVNLHCKDIRTNHHVNLNYVAAVVLSDTRLNEPKEGVLIDLKEYPTAQTLVNNLAKCWMDRPRSLVGLKAVQLQRRGKHPK